MSRPLRICFLCHGNICRSPMAEFVMKEILRREGIGNVEVSSAALRSDEIGSDIHHGTRAKLRIEGIPFTPRAAWLMTRAKSKFYDLLIGMDAYNRRDLENLLPQEDHGKIRLLLSFAGSDGSIADPWYTGDFDATYRDVLAGCKGLAAAIAADPGGLFAR